MGLRLHSIGELEPVPLGDRRSMVYKGTAVAQGMGRAVVTGVGMATEVDAIAKMLDAPHRMPGPRGHQHGGEAHGTGAGRL